MKALLDDLLDFNRTKLGLGIDIARTQVDLAILFADQVAELRGAHPDHPLELEVRGDCRGMWDGRRLEQLLANLVANAMKYGTPHALVRVVVTGEEKDVRIDVINSGQAIDPAILGQMFEPLQSRRAACKYRWQPRSRPVHRTRNCKGAWRRDHRAVCPF